MVIVFKANKPYWAKNSIRINTRLNESGYYRQVKVCMQAAIPALKWNPTQIHAQRHPELARDDVCFSQVGHGFLRRELLIDMVSLNLA